MNTPMETPRTNRWKTMSPSLSEHPNYSYIEVVRASDYDALERSLIAHKALVRECEKYMEHLDHNNELPCAKWYYSESDEQWYLSDAEKCDCGLDALLARLKEASDGQ